MFVALNDLTCTSFADGLCLDVSITAHNGFINGILRAIGRTRYILPTGGSCLIKSCLLRPFPLALALLSRTCPRDLLFVSPRTSSTRFTIFLFCVHPLEIRARILSASQWANAFIFRDLARCHPMCLMRREHVDVYSRTGSSIDH